MYARSVAVTVAVEVEIEIALPQGAAAGVPVTANKQTNKRTKPGQKRSTHPATARVSVIQGGGGPTYKAHFTPAPQSPDFDPDGALPVE